VYDRLALSVKLVDAVFDCEGEDDTDCVTLADVENDVVIVPLELRLSETLSETEEVALIDAEREGDWVNESEAESVDVSVTDNDCVTVSTPMRRLPTSRMKS